jgi:hypothetical protein
VNIYKKYCQNVYVAECDEKHGRGDIIILTTKYGKENECIVYNNILQRNGKYYYSIVRKDGFNSQERAKNRADKLADYAQSADKRADEWCQKSNEGKDFLALGEPIKIGHHSEKRHRALIDRNDERMRKSVNAVEEAEKYRERVKYWKALTDKIDLSMPESIEFFKAQLAEAEEYHKCLKEGTIEKEHSLSLSYAKKNVNLLRHKYEIATKLWS